MEKNFEAVEELTGEEPKNYLEPNIEDRTPIVVTVAAVAVGGAIMYAGYLVGSRCRDSIKDSGTKFVNWVKGKSEKKSK